MNITTTSLVDRRHGPGICSIRGSCGKKSIFDPELPCPDDGDADSPSTELKAMLMDICGPSFETPDTVCCTIDQAEALRDNLLQAEPLIAACPACRNSFRSFYCHFTCSPSQSTFLEVLSTQTMPSSPHQEAVKEINVYVSPEFKQSFYDSCKDVQFGATNGLAMDLIGGGAKDPEAFLRYMGKLRPGLGSPFQINFPSSLPETEDEDRWSPVSPTKLHCDDPEIYSRCACADCPSICPSLPYLPTPSGESRMDPIPGCHIGRMSCTSFVVTLSYLAAVLIVTSLWIMDRIAKKKKQSWERRILLGDDDQPGVDTEVDAQDGRVISPSSTRHKPGASRRSTSDLFGTTIGSEELGLSNDDDDGRARVGSLLDPIGRLQPRQSKVNVWLKKGFYRLGLMCAQRAYTTFIVALLVLALLNLGWKRFSVETDPVHLWVSPTSSPVLEKNHFDQSFGPFFRPQQIFITSSLTDSSSSASLPDRQGTASIPTPIEPALSYERLNWWLEHERTILSMRSIPNNYTYEDVCYSPAGPGTACIVQSISVWFDALTGGEVDEDEWQDVIKGCSDQPSDCLAESGMILEPKFILGGLPSESTNWLNVSSFITTFVLQGTLDEAGLLRAEEWERSLRSYLEDVVNSPKELEAGRAWIGFSTGVSLEEELNKASNLDKLVVGASYLGMLVYVTFTLGGSQGGSLIGLAIELISWIASLFGLTDVLGMREKERGGSAGRRQRIKNLLRTALINSKFSLGVFGILVVVISISTSVGVFSALGVKVTLIIAEVIPFLVLAVGVDNVFILVNELDRQNALHGPLASPSSIQQRSSHYLQGQSFTEDPFAITPSSSSTGPNDTIASAEQTQAPTELYLSPEERVARTLARMGPSILLSSLTETVAFGLGALVPMPAVRNFALYAAGSVAIDAILQVTIFVAALTLDLKRVEAHRMDCLPFIKLDPEQAIYLESTVDNEDGEDDDEDDGGDDEIQAGFPASNGEGWINRVIRKYYAPFLLKRETKSAVLLIFSGLFALALVGVQKVELGLDQRLALPSDSYLIPYFDAVDQYLDIGPPVYFVVDHLNVTERPAQQALCGRFTTCDELSVASTLDAERKRPEVSFLSNAPAVWIDDFFQWLNPVLESCCRVRKDDPDVFCSPEESERGCQPCFLDRDPPFDTTMQGFPEGPEFMRYLGQWLQTPTDENCPLGGRSSYSNALSFSKSRDAIEASHFRTYHTPLKKGGDFINALASARRIAKDMEDRIGARVYPYSLFYIFFDQYAHVITILVEVLTLALVSIFFVTSLLLGSWRTGTIVTGVCALAVTSVMGLMGVWGVSLNAISLVNLVISLGIAVEFCSHIARAFMGAGGGGLPYDHPLGPKERDERAWSALVDVGGSVFSGITLTKLIGVTVLAFTRSKLLEVYFFRMWLSLIISGALHGLVLLPVLLSLFGGRGYEFEEADEEWMLKAARSGIEYTPFHDVDSISSD